MEGNQPPPGNGATPEVPPSIPGFGVTPGAETAQPAISTGETPIGAVPPPPPTSELGTSSLGSMTLGGSEQPAGPTPAAQPEAPGLSPLGVPEAPVAAPAQNGPEGGMSQFVNPDDHEAPPPPPEVTVEPVAEPAPESMPVVEPNTEAGKTFSTAQVKVLIHLAGLGGQANALSRLGGKLSPADLDGEIEALMARVEQDLFGNEEAPAT